MEGTSLFRSRGSGLRECPAVPAAAAVPVVRYSYGKRRPHSRGHHHRRRAAASAGEQPLKSACEEADDEDKTNQRAREMLDTQTSMEELCRSMERVDTHEGRLPPLNELFQALRLQSLSEEELRKVFASVDENGNGSLNYTEVEELVKQRLAEPSSNPETIQKHVRGIMSTFDLNQDGEVSYTEFADKVKDLSQAIDKRVLPLAVLVGLVGLAAGMVQPLMPLMIKDIGMSLSEYGMISCVYGLLKTLANVPAAILQDTLGRLPVMLWALAAMGCGFTGIGFSTGFLPMLLSRASVGMGISTWNIATTSYSLDVSHALNRARSMAPALTAFSIGGIAGPFLGGCIVEQVGLRAAFFVVAGILVFAGLVLRLTLEETRTPQHRKDERGRHDKRPMLDTLKDIIWNPEMHATIAVNGANRLIMGTAKCTLLPLLLVNNLGLGTAQVGMVFSAMSAFALVTAQPAAAFSDTVGHRRALVPAAACQGLAVLLLPLCNFHVAATGVALTVWAVSHALINSSMYPHVSALAGPQMHSQSLATLKFTGDMATIFGGLLGGVLAHHSSVGTAIAVLAGLQLLSALWLLMESAARDSPEPLSTVAAV
eukprot:CAMPEP_0117674014 /NCGR_PEP_ID=MMETSP0804-20121206/14799_1 /TAXON_ID=1074897 /ORGANISM="Tetraselmis astigmatica, Strain CCMP880" /LENGTH=597 /DNA_ID=CAMNT_0005482829 /DNA_START=194 /DNA_END=1987 /DNA_ORIENTATION=+